MRSAEAWRPRRSLIRRILLLVLIATLAIFLNGCGNTVLELRTCPTWPEDGPVVAKGVERGMMPANQFPAFWEWMGCVDEMRDQLIAC